MVKGRSKSQPKWTDVKVKLASLDHLGLLSLLQHLYAARTDNQTLLHNRFGLVEDVLETYKQTITRWLYPDIFRRQDTTSVAKAKQAIADYKAPDVMELVSELPLTAMGKVDKRALGERALVLERVR